MRDKELYATILGVRPPWQVLDVALDAQEGEIEVFIGAEPDVPLPCPRCETLCSRYDTRQRRWRHLDTCQYRTILVAEVPRIRCQDHGILQITVPWAEPGSRFTALFEALAIDWLKEASISAVARMLRLSWDEVDGIMSRAVERGLKRRARQPSQRIAVDETSFQKRHEYVTVVSDAVDGVVLYVADDRKQSSLDGFYDGLGAEALEAVEAVVMDMWGPYIASTIKYVPGAARKIGFDKFHVAGHLGEAVDRVRRQEHRGLTAVGSSRLKGTKWLWLENPLTMSEDRRWDLESLRKSSLKTARAWGIKELAMSLWNYSSRGWALKAWRRWLSWAMRSRLEPVKRVARMIQEHLWGIINAIVLGVTNGRAEGLNSKIQRIKRMACGYRNRQRFRNAIYFHLGALDLYPRMDPA
jgi:transposase